MASGRIALTLLGAGKSPVKLARHGVKIAFHPARAPDEDVIVIIEAALWQSAAQKLAKTPFHAIAHHRITDLLGHRYAHALAQSFIG